MGRHSKQTAKTVPQAAGLRVIINDVIIGRVSMNVRYILDTHFDTPVLYYPSFFKHNAFYEM